MPCGIVTKYKEITASFCRPQKPEQNTWPHHWKHDNHQPGTSELHLHPSSSQALEPSQPHIKAGCDRNTGSCWLGGSAPDQSGQLHIQTCNQARGWSNIDGVWTTATKFLWMFKLSEKSGLLVHSNFSFVDCHNFIAKFAIPGIVIHVLHESVPVARWLGKTYVQVKFLALRFADKSFKMSP